jgi:CubicO group peptidase (beta-lactamase class C family)
MLLEKSITEIDHVLNEEVEKQKTPSVQYLLFNKEQIIHRFQMGLADIKNQIIVNANTTYNAFSVTKTFTALAILQLEAQQRMNIDYPVKKYLPDFPYSPEITIRQILSHAAGIPNPIPLSWIHLAGEHESLYRNRFSKSIFTKNNKTKFKPNERYSYSNLGYVLLGEMIEKVSGMKYEQYININIILPLGLQSKDLGFRITDLDHHAKGYQKQVSFSNALLGFFIDRLKYMSSKEGKWIPFKPFYVNGASYGGLIGTQDAFVKYIQELLKQDGALLKDDFKKKLFTENHTAAGKATGMCLSWLKGELNGNVYFSHPGGGGGYYCEIRIYPKAGLGSVIMFNRSGMTDERFLDKVDKFYFENG